MNHQKSSEGIFKPEHGRDQPKSLDKENDFSLKKAATSLNRFIECAHRGAFPGASSGEKIANKIANLLAVIGDDAAEINDNLIEGACEMLRLQHGPWRTDADKLDVFRLLDRALGK